MSAVPVPPWEIQLATVCWVGAVSAGGVETVLGAADALSTGSAPTPAVLAGMALRAVLFTGVLAAASQLWNGRGWARGALAVLVGGLATMTLLSGPVGWLLDGAPWSAVHLDPGFVSLAAVRSVHVLAVWAAIVLMFRPAASVYLRPS